MTVQRVELEHGGWAEGITVDGQLVEIVEYTAAGREIQRIYSGGEPENESAVFVPSPAPA